MRTSTTRRLLRAAGIAGCVTIAAGLTACEDPNEPTPAGDLAEPRNNNTGTGTGTNTGTGGATNSGDTGVSEDTQPSGDGDPAGSGQP